MKTNDWKHQKRGEVEIITSQWKPIHSIRHKTIFGEAQRKIYKNYTKNYKSIKKKSIKTEDSEKTHFTLKQKLTYGIYSKKWERLKTRIFHV